VFNSSFQSLGRIHTRWDHVYRGLPVLGSQMITHGKGLAPTPSMALAMGPGGVPFAPPIPGGLEPSVSRNQAEAAVLARLGPHRRHPRFPVAALVLFPVLEQIDLALPGETNADAYPFVVSNWTLAWRVVPRWTREDTAPEDTEYLVDAHTGGIIRERPLVRELGTSHTGVGHTLFNGTVPLRTTALTGGGFELRDLERADEKGGNTIFLSHPHPNGWGYDASGARIFAKGEDIWGNGKPDDQETVAASAAFALQSSLDYFWYVHGWKGPDGKGMPVQIIIDYPMGSDNAGWLRSSGASTKGLIFVSKSKNYWPLVNLTVLGHELTHGVVESRAGLNQGPESAGLNEAFADFFGTMIDTWTRTGGGHPEAKTRNLIGDRDTFWTITVRQQDGSDKVMRNMAAPNSVGHPAAWSPELREISDEHIQAGPMDRAFFLLSRGALDVGGEQKDPVPASGESKDPAPVVPPPEGMAGLGNDRTAAIAFEALMTRMGPMSGYRETRKAMLEAATGLYGADSGEVDAVMRAFGAIGVGKAGRLKEPIDALIQHIEVRAQVEATDVILSAVVPDPAQVRCMTFLVDGFPEGKVTAAPFTLRLPASQHFKNGRHSFQVIIRDVEDIVLEAPAETTFELANAAQQLLTDPGLESKRRFYGWNHGITSFRQNHPDHPAHGGEQFAEYRPGSIYTPWGLEQEVFSLPTGVALQLHFWIWGQAGPTPGGVLQLIVQEVATPPSLPPLEMTFDPADVREAWTERTCDLSAFAGRTVKIRFEGIVDKGATSVFRLDDITLMATPAPIPAP
jgi:Zn-dependent metalloprotease